MYGPSLWFAWASLNLISGFAVVFWFVRSLPTTVSPTWKDPWTGVTSSSLGTVRDLLSDISVLEKKLKKFVDGFNLAALNSIFWGLRFGIADVVVITSVVPTPPSIVLNSLSIQISLLGFNSILPFQVTTSNGLTFTVLLANGWLKSITSE